MLRIQTPVAPDRILAALGELVARGDRATGHIVDHRFSLQPTSGRFSVPAVLRGRVDTDAGGALVVAWPFPHWLMILAFPVWAWIAFEYVHAPIWFVAIGFFVCATSFVAEMRKGYDLIREACAP